jgi:hemerythrin-like metal-binding protein
MEMVMSIFEWNPTWETGNAVIDSQHRQLFQQLSHLYTAIEEGKGGGETERALMLMGEYVETHFKDEERLMRQSGYRGITRHIEIHVVLRNHVNSMIEAYLKDNQPIPEAVLDFLGDWLKDHLDGEDRLLAAHLRQYTK